MTATVKGRGVRIELGATYGAPLQISDVTRANPPVATTAAPHGLVDGSAGYFDGMLGMPIEGQAALLANSTGSTFEVPGLNTSPLSSFAAGYFVPVLTWLALAESTSYTLTQGSREYMDATTVLDRIARRKPANFGPGSLTLNLIAQTTPSAAMRLLESAAQIGTALVVRITHPDGAVRIARGCPSWPGEDVQQGAVGTSAVEFAIDGFALRIDGSIVIVPPPPPPPPASQDYSSGGDYFATGSDYVQTA